MDTTNDTGRLNELIGLWTAYRASVAQVNLYTQLSQDLYQVRNAGWRGNPPVSFWPAYLVDPDDAMMAAVEHYFLCRAWVGTGAFPAWQVTAMNVVYDLGKMAGVTPRHNPNKPTSPLTALQMAAKVAGVRDGSNDLRNAGRRAPMIAMPPKYY